MNEFTVHLVSSASMNIFPDNTLANFRYFFNEEIILEGDRRVVMSEIIFPSRINQINNNFLRTYSFGGNNNYQSSIPTGAVSRPYTGELVSIGIGSYENIEHLLRNIRESIGLPHFSYQFDKVAGILVLNFGKNEGITFPDTEIQSILGYEGMADGSGFHIGYKMLDSFQMFSMSEEDLEPNKGDYPFDLLAGKQLIFVYTDVVEYQYVGDTKTPLICVIYSKQRLKNGSPCGIEPTHRIVLSNLEYKKLLSKNFRSIRGQLRTETGRFVSFTGTGKDNLALSSKKFD